MHVPSAEELAAIAAAYLIVTEPSEPLARTVSRWALAGRVETDPDAIRGTCAGAHRWATAARLDTA
jgi:hypothetical protein